MDFCFVYITTKDKEEARRIGRALLEGKLAACINIGGPIESLYYWEGKIVEDREAALVAKTRSALVEPLIAQVKAIHSYSCPCIVSVPVVAGNPEFWEWIERETRES